MAALSPLPKFQFFSTAGVPLSGGKLYSYEAGTTTPLATYTTEAGNVAHTNPVILDSRGEASVWLGSGGPYKLILKDSNDVEIWTVDNIHNLTADLASSSGSSLIGFIQAGTGAVVRTAQAKMRERVSVTDFGASTAASAATNTTAFQNALNLGGEIIVPGGTFNLNPITIEEDYTTLILAPDTVLNYTTLGTNTHGITVNANYFEIHGGKLVGPGVGSDVGNEAGIWMEGTNTGSRKTGLVIDDVEATNFGQYGFYARFVNDIRMTNCYIHDTRLHGAAWFSCNNIYETGNQVDTIILNSSNNAYGIMHSHATPDGWSILVDPFCLNLYCAGNTIQNIAWEGIDSHGADDFTIVNNKIYNTKFGISASNSSNIAAGYAGKNNIVMGNVVTGYKQDGTLGNYAYLGYGINLNGGTTVKNRQVICMGNVLTAKGVVNSSADGSILAQYCSNVVISDNIIEAWAGVGIYTNDSTGQIINNTFGGCYSSGDSGRECIRIDGTVSDLTLVGNNHNYGALNAAREGVRISVDNTIRQTLSGNNFQFAAVPYEPASGDAIQLFVLGTDVTPRIDYTGSGPTLSVAAFKGWDGVVSINNDSGTITIDQISNMKIGQKITLLGNSANAHIATIESGGVGAIYLAGGTNKTLVRPQTLVVQYLLGRVTQLSYSDSAA